MAMVRAFELTELYSDHPVDLADASRVAAAESIGPRKSVQVDRKDFETHRVRRGDIIGEIRIRHTPLAAPAAPGRLRATRLVRKG